MSLKAKILLLALLPLLVLTASVTLIAVNQVHSLSELEIRTFEDTLLESKKTELRHYVSLALTSIEHLYQQSELSEAQAQERVKQILHHLTYGEDGYFFVYDRDGTNLVHPIIPELVGRNLLDLQDANGDFIIRNLWAEARQGGGFHRYLWKKPSRGEQVDKLSYVIELPRWGWMLGTGLYIDDIAEEVAHIRKQVQLNIRNTFFTVLVITALTVIVVILMGVAFNVHELRLADARLRRLAQQSVQFHVAERRRFSRELHDGINQLLVAVKFRLELVQRGLGPVPLQEELNRGQQGLEQAITEVRRISHDLRPTVLDDLGLHQALQSLLAEFSERTDIQVEHHSPLAAQQLPEEIEITLYRLIQEALTNIEKHADASRVWIQMYWRGDSFWLEIHDNGNGFDPADRRNQQGIGLTNMRERVELLSGEFRLEAEPGNGTHVQARFPMSLYRKGVGEDG